MDENKEYTCTCCNSQIEESYKNPAQSRKVYIPAGISLFMLLTGIAMDNFLAEVFNSYFRLAWYILAYIPVAYPVFREAVETIRQKEVFTEFTLMIIATSGAFFIGEYPEGVAVMLFYSIGELFQNSAVNKAKRSIKALLDVRPDKANVERNGNYIAVSPEEVTIGETIQVKAGEKVPLDGTMISGSGIFNTSALTGESKPKVIREGEAVLAGMLNMDKVIRIEVTKKYEDSSLSRILEMVQEATSRKARTELLIRRFAKVYTPVIFLLAVLITVIPYFLVNGYIFQDWLYRALVFLVISCPCALVISIPLGYFGGIGAASKAGILFKGANYLDLMTKVNTVVMDKTGTLTKGVFKVQDVVAGAGFTKEEFIGHVSALEKMSNHPIAKAIVDSDADKNNIYTATDVHEISGQGLTGKVNGNEVMAGNAKMMQNNHISYDKSVDSIPETTVIVAINNVYAGYIIIADEVKEDAARAVKDMHANGIGKVVMLSGDKSSIAENIASHLGIDKASGDLLPEDKVRHLEELKANNSNVIAFVGDGINDTPSLALSDVGIAMGGMGSDAAIEVADVIIQTDQPSKVATAIRIAGSTKKIVYQNIMLAFSIKLTVLVLGGFGLANMWEAVFADVGVSLLAILNAVRILKMKFDISHSDSL
ncbi:heavy metal translocating P-type ATPase [Dysgonomonas termitidis]|uniref:P-type Zn(2+) transporter n=1 Tax=Dysgonomonas termitidis TaxID=1516126 RepID=A0ABV9KPV3_9BACT